MLFRFICRRCATGSRKSFPWPSIAEGMLSRLAAQAHRLWVLIETLLHGFETMFVLPSRNPPLWSRCTLRFERTGRRPIAAQGLAILLVRVTIAKLLTSRAAVRILCRQIDEVLLAEAAFRLRARRHRLRQRHGNIGLRARQNLGAVEVAAISDGIELVSTKNLLCLRGDFGKL